MEKQLKKIFSLLLIMFLFSSCSQDDGRGYIFKYDVRGNPSTLDPQKAMGETAELVITNLFEGLLKLDKNGNIEPAVAGEYEISEDGLIYTFYLRENVYWTDKNGFSELCTADDFVYGFTRLFNPAIKSQNAEKFYSIKNSKQVNNGQIVDIYDIGVKALSKFILQIELESPNPFFLDLLTSTAAMPCNEKYYINSAGRYGLTSEATPSNGSFFLYKWNFDHYSTNNNNLILRRNKLNNEKNEIFPAGVNLYINESDELNNFTSGERQSIILSGEEAEKLIALDYPHNGYENSVWGIVFNMKSVFKNYDLRYGLASALERSKIDVFEMGYKSTDVLIPDIIKLGDNIYRVMTELETIVPYSNKASEMFSRGRSGVGFDSTDGLNLIIPDNEFIYKYISYITQQWQTELGFFCNIKVMDYDNYNNSLNNGNFDFAAIKITGDYNSPSSFLKNFSGNTTNISSYISYEYDNYISEAEHTADAAESAEKYYKSEKMLLSQAIFIPITFQTEYFIYSKDSSDIIYNPFTRTIDYKNAKNFS